MIIILVKNGKEICAHPRGTRERIEVMRGSAKLKNREFTLACLFSPDSFFLSCHAVRNYHTPHRFLASLFLAAEGILFRAIRSFFCEGHLFLSLCPDYLTTFRRPFSFNVRFSEFRSEQACRNFCIAVLRGRGFRIPCNPSHHEECRFRTSNNSFAHKPLLSFFQITVASLECVSKSTASINRVNFLPI